jgi:hypothetical protein
VNDTLALVELHAASAWLLEKNRACSTPALALFARLARAPAAGAETTP